MFEKYNGVLRAMPGKVPPFVSKYMQLCDGNRYVATLHACSGLLCKLGRLTSAAKVYRGISGGALPKTFFEKNEFNVRGGIEYAFTSTTLNREVAVKYASSGKVGMIIEVQMGMVDRGAELTWLSQVCHTLSAPPARETPASTRRP